MVWGRANEGLAPGCTAKGKKEGNKQAHFIAAIYYGKGFICCEQYEGKCPGNYLQIPSRIIVCKFSNEAQMHA